VLDRARRHRYTPPDLPTFDELCDTADDGSTEHVLQNCVVWTSSPHSAGHATRPRLRARRHQPLDVLTDREVISDAHA